MIPKKPLILIFYKAMFAGKDVYYKKVKIPLRKIGGLKRYDINNLLFIEQDPHKKTEWGKRAKKGAKICWIIDTKWNKYLYRIEDGKITKLRTSLDKKS